MNSLQVAIAGSGSMGSRIALCTALAGIDTLLIDTSPTALERAVNKIAGLIKRIDSLSAEEQERVRSKIKTAPDIAEINSSDIIIEAIFEQETVKKTVLGEISEAAKTGAVLASNTSSISITRLAGATKYPESFIGIHFMNPADKMELVEIVRGEKTSEDTYKRALSFCGRLGKTTVTSIDSPGFIVNRVIMPMINEAVWLLQNNVATAEDIDKSLTLGAHHPMGPLALADFIGLDVCIDIMSIMQRDTGDKKFKPADLLVKKVKAGSLGKKSGKGFFNWEQP